MTAPAIDIERIVREVVRRLATAQPQSNELRVDGPVVSLADIQNRLEGANRIVVARSAIVTPAARDLLKEHNLTIEQSFDTNDRVKHKRRLSLAVVGSTFNAAGLMKALAADGVEVQPLARGALIAAVEELDDAISKGGGLGLLLTAEPAAAACLANRRRGIRAALAGTVDELDQAIMSIGLNLLIIHPQGKGAFEINRLVRVFCRERPNDEATYSRHLNERV